MIGIVYKITSPHTEKQYVGSTCQKYLCTRLIKIRNAYKRYTEGRYPYMTAFAILKFPDCKIIEIKRMEVENIKDLRLAEQEQIKAVPNTVNKNMPGRTPVESQKASRLKRKEREREELNKLVANMDKIMEEFD